MELENVWMPEHLEQGYKFFSEKPDIDDKILEELEFDYYLDD